MVSRLKHMITVSLINLLIVALGIVILELVFGHWVHSDNLSRLNVIRSRTIKHDVSGLYDSPSRAAIYSRDKYGLRGSFSKPSEIDILTVGGSTTDQRYISDGETWQDALEQRFAAIGKKVVVANAGVDGQSTVGHIRDFDWWFPNIPSLRPRYVLFYVGANDFYVGEGSGYDALMPQGNRKSLGESVREKSAIYRAFRTLYGIYRARVALKIAHRHVDFSKVEWTTTPLRNSYDGLMHERLREYKERLTILIAKTRDLGAAPIFITQPSRKYRFTNGVIEGIREQSLYAGAPINGVDFYYMMRALDGVAASVCRNNNVTCIDMAEEPIWEDDDFYDFAHMTPKGAAKVGGYLFGRLRDKF
jgi:hypothetical protein